MNTEDFLDAWTALGAMKPTLGVIAPDGAEGSSFLCCTRLAAVTTQTVILT